VIRAIDAALAPPASPTCGHRSAARSPPAPPIRSLSRERGEAWMHSSLPRNALKTRVAASSPPPGALALHAKTRDTSDGGAPPSRRQPDRRRQGVAAPDLLDAPQEEVRADVAPVPTWLLTRNPPTCGLQSFPTKTRPCQAWGRANPLTTSPYTLNSLGRPARPRRPLMRWQWLSATAGSIPSHRRCADRRPVDVTNC